MKILNRKFLILSTLVAMMNCGQSQNYQQSETRSIGTDLPDNGTNGPDFLFWIQGSRIIRAECREQEVPDTISHENCDKNPESMSYNKFMRDLDGGLKATITQLQKEASHIRAVMKIIEKEIEKAVDRIQEIKDQHGAISDELREAKNKLSRFQRIAKELREQLKLIEDKLKALISGDLAQQRLLIMKQISAFMTKMQDLGREIADLLFKIGDLNDQISDLQDRIDRLRNRMSNLQYDLGIVNTKLGLAYDDLFVYEDTLDLLEENLIYHVVTDNVWYRKNRQFVRRFNHIFASN